MSKRVYWGLELGSSKISLCGIKTPSDMFYLESFSSPHIDGGVVKDFYGLVEFLDKIFSEAEKKTSFQIDSLVCCLKSKHIVVKNSFFKFALTSEKERLINRRDVEYLKEQSSLLGRSWDQKLLLSIPQYFLVDESQRIYEPQGLWARSLGGEFMLFLCNVSFYDNLRKLFEYLGRDLKGLLSSSYASYVAAERSFKEGVLIDMGEKLTEVLVFRDNRIIKRYLLDFGGADLDIKMSQSLEVSLELCQRIRQDFLDFNASENEELMLKIGDDYLSYKVRDITKIIEEPLKEFVCSLKNCFQQDSLSSFLRSNIYLCGGVALTKGLRRYFGSLFEPGAELVVLQNPAPSHELSSLGCAKYNFSLSQKTPDKGLGRAIRFLKALYQEYL